MQLFENVACTVCGCVCDDLRIAVEGERVSQAEGACPLAQDWFLGQNSRQPPVSRVEGQPAPLEEALDRAADILRTASSPLIYGLSRSSLDGQRAAISLGEKIGATIDTTASLCHAPSVMALQEVGEVACTLGEVKNRADLVIYWGANPVETHPRHMERYAVLPRGRFTDGGRADRTVVVADVKLTASAALADVFLPLEPDGDFEALTTLLNLVRGRPVKADRGIGNPPLRLLEELAERMKKCRFGIIFFGLGLTLSGSGQHNIEALLLLVRELNATTRFCARKMRIQGNVTGADTVLIWQTGYPFSVNFFRGYPRYNPGEFSAHQMLERGEVDACLLVGSEGTVRFSPAASAHLSCIPTIVLDHPTIESLFPTTVAFTTAVYGVHQPGTAFRMDGVPIPLKSFLPTNYPTDAEVLGAIAERIG